MRKQTAESYNNQFWALYFCSYCKHWQAHRQLFWVHLSKYWTSRHLWIIGPIIVNCTEYKAWSWVWTRICELAVVCDVRAAIIFEFLYVRSKYIKARIFLKQWLLTENLPLSPVFCSLQPSDFPGSSGMHFLYWNETCRKWAYWNHLYEITVDTQVCSKSWIKGHLFYVWSSNLSWYLNQDLQGRVHIYLIHNIIAQ